MTHARTAGRCGRPWRRVRALVIARDEQERDGCCWWCGQPVDTSLPGTHLDGPSVDHLDPLAHDGDPLDPGNLGLMHLRCNLAKGLRTITEAPAWRSSGRTSRRWL